VWLCGVCSVWRAFCVYLRVLACICVYLRVLACTCAFSRSWCMRVCVDDVWSIVWGRCPQFLVSIVVSIPACHAGDPGSIPGRGASLFFSYTLPTPRRTLAPYKHMSRSHRPIPTTPPSSAETTRAQTETDSCLHPMVNSDCRVRSAPRKCTPPTTTSNYVLTDV
jgi:hypothetical protein